MLFGCGLLGGTEALLRASGRYADPPVPQMPEGWGDGVRLARSRMGPFLEATQVDGAPGRRTSRRLVEQRFMHDLAWRVQPQVDRPRVVAFGGSTTLGVPVEREPARTFPGRLSAWLAAGGSPAEVLNLGGASFGTDQIVELMGDMAGDGAAVWIMYEGNNEFFQYNLRWYEMNAEFPGAQVHLRQLHLFRVLEGLLDAPPTVGGVADAREQQKQQLARMMEATLADPSSRPVVDAQGRWSRQDPPAIAVRARFRTNLQQMEARAAQAQATLLIVDVQPNLQQEPWLSLHDPELSFVGRERVARALADAMSSADRATAVGLAEGAVAIDPVYARSWWVLGMARLAAGDPAGAEPALRNALELDMNPGRPIRDFNDAVHAVTVDGGSVRVDLSPMWAAPASGPFGGRLYQDACHLTPEAYDGLGALLAVHVAPLLPAPR